MKTDKEHSHERFSALKKVFQETVETWKNYFLFTGMVLLRLFSGLKSALCESCLNSTPVVPNHCSGDQNLLMGILISSVPQKKLN